jgi:hypothetical protein
MVMAIAEEIGADRPPKKVSQRPILPVVGLVSLPASKQQADDEMLELPAATMLPQGEQSVRERADVGITRGLAIDLGRDHTSEFMGRQHPASHFQLATAIRAGTCRQRHFGRNSEGL